MTLVNAARGFSPFVIVDFMEEDVALMQQYHEYIINAYLVSTSEVKSIHTKLTPITPTDSEGFMMILKRFANLLFALFSSSFPLYKQVYDIIKGPRDYLKNARSALHHNKK